MAVLSSRIRQKGRLADRASLLLVKIGILLLAYTIVAPFVLTSTVSGPCNFCANANAPLIQTAFPLGIVLTFTGIVLMLITLMLWSKDTTIFDLLSPVALIFALVSPITFGFDLVADSYVSTTIATKVFVWATPFALAISIILGVVFFKSHKTYKKESRSVAILALILDVVWILFVLFLVFIH